MARAGFLQCLIVCMLWIGIAMAQSTEQDEEGGQVATSTDEESECKQDVWDNYLLRPAGRGGAVGTIRDLILQRGTSCRTALADKTKEVFGPASVSKQFSISLFPH